MNRRNFLSCLSALPLCGFLKRQVTVGSRVTTKYFGPKVSGVVMKIMSLSETPNPYFYDRLYDNRRTRPFVRVKLDKYFSPRRNLLVCPIEDLEVI